MIDIIKKFFLFLLPIIKTAAAQAAVDELSKIANPRPSYRRYTSYNRMVPRTRRQAVMNVGRAVREAEDFKETDESAGGFHDVLMVAFDLTGPNAALVHEWLHNHMPAPNDSDDKVHLDSWWVANDERFDRSDCSSAVFVPMGKQAEVRKLLREHGLMG